MTLMDDSVKFSLDVAGVQQVVYGSSKLNGIERQVMERALSEAKATFLQEFGTDGNLVLEYLSRPVGGKTAQYLPGARRPVYRIRAGDAKTGAILKARPGWLAKFSREAKL